MGARDIIQSILAGQADDDIEAVYRALDVRQRLISEAKAAELRADLKPGDKVRISDRISPKYLAGELATVLSINGSQARIELDNQWTRERAARRFGTTIRTPLGLLEKP